MITEIVIGALWAAAIGILASEHKKKKEKEKEEIVREVEQRLRKKEDMLNKIREHPDHKNT